MTTTATLTLPPTSHVPRPYEGPTRAEVLRERRRFTHPATVTSDRDPRVLVVAAGLWLTRGENNVFTQIGLIVLIGLAAKNAILIVEFAVRRREEGAGIVDAALDAARLRLRPILMTSIAFIAGVFPLVVSTGAGSEMRRAMGVAVFAGMIGVTLFGLFLTPVFYVVLEKIGVRKPSRRN